MNKKLKQYLLLLLVLGIWAALGFRFFSMLSGEEAGNSTVLNYKPVVANVKQQKDYVMKGNYPDPFLKHAPLVVKRRDKEGSLPLTMAQGNVKEKKVNVKETEKKVINEFPELRLTAVIVNAVNGKKSAIMMVEGKEYSLNAGEAVNGIRLARVYSDSVLVVWQKKNKVLRI